ncbi:MAG: hypothetical protein HOV81_19300 [Kofleriaceae bacterium]|nr:hypothetical protein [Kofleriaceae bacterium]
MTVAVCAVFAARTVASLTEAEIDEIPTRTAPREIVAPAPAPREKLDPEALVARNMFCSTCTPEPGLTPGPTDSFVPDAQLIATSIGKEPVATVHVRTSDVQGSWGLGETIPGIGTVARISYVSIDVTDGQGRVGTLSLLEKSSGGRSDDGAATPTPAAAADPFNGRIKKIDDATFEVDRSIVRELVSGNVKLAGARISPITGKDGKLSGLRMFAVRGDGAASKIGLQNSDMIEAINNIKIENANTLLGLVAQLDTMTTVELAGTRRGKPLTVTLRLQ